MWSFSVSVNQGTIPALSMDSEIFTMVSCLWTAASCSSSARNWNQEWFMSISWWCHSSMDFLFLSLRPYSCLRSTARTMNPKFRPTELCQDATLIFKDDWISWAKNYIPFPCLPLHPDNKFSSKASFSFSPLEPQILVFVTIKMILCFSQLLLWCNLRGCQWRNKLEFSCSSNHQDKWIASVHSVKWRQRGQFVCV